MFPPPALPAWLAAPVLLALTTAATSYAEAPVRAAKPSLAPLHERIDRLIGAGRPDFEARAAAPASDAEFLRRVYLDLIGTIPSTEKVRTFLNDVSPNKRRRLIDRLLDDPRHLRHLVHVFDVMLMERRPSKHVPQGKWRAWLRASFKENKPLDQLVREILTADGSDPHTRPAAKFLLDRELDKNLITRDIGRIFLGRDMQCCQCHDHPLVFDYLQRHYYGLKAFLSRSYLFKDPKLDKTIIAEKAEGQVTFTSVFTGEKGETAPRMLELSAIPDPKGEDGYLTKPTDKTAGVPQYSRRLLLAEAVTDPQNAAFRKNFANRIWAMVLGRGLVEPVDMWHSVNPPSHPELAKVLAGALQESGYDLRYMLREIALTQTYQRSSVLPEGASPPPRDSFTVALLKPLSPEQLAWSTMRATGLVDVTLAKLEEKAVKDDPENGPTMIQDPVWREKALRNALSKHVERFVGAFASTTLGNRFDATVDQALFLRNGSLVRSWITPQPGNLTHRLAQIDDPAKIAEELYLSVLSRRPSPEEVKIVREYLATIETGEKSETGEKGDTTGLEELVWALLASAEFRLNH